MTQAGGYQLSSDAPAALPGGHHQHPDHRPVFGEDRTSRLARCDVQDRAQHFALVVCDQEFGLAGNLFIIVCFLLLVWRGLAIAMGAGTLFGRLMAGAVSTIFFTYAFVNMGMVSGILPVVGVPLPFISYGGTAMVTLGLALGVLMSVARAQRLPVAPPLPF